MTQTAMATAGVHYFYHESPPPSDWESSRHLLSQVQLPFFSMSPLVVMIEAHPEQFHKIFELFSEIHQLQLNTQIVLFNCRLKSEQLLRLMEVRKPFRILLPEFKKEIEKSMLSAMELVSKARQDQVLLDLFHEQNSELKKISVELEAKIDKRQKHLQETREKLFHTNQKATFLQECLFAIHNSENIPELEAIVAKILQEPMSLLGFRILFKDSQADRAWSENQELSLYHFSLYQGERQYGSLVFARDKSLSFRREDRDFLDQIGEAISLCLERMLQVERNKDLQSQWQATFNSISDPICLVDKDFHIRIANKNFLQRIREIPENLKFQEVEFPLRLKLTGDKGPLIFEVSRQSMLIDYQPHHFYLFRDISQQINFERQLVDSAKLAELGTISSSIAHELNNPLGGMLNFLQLIQMDLKGDESFVAEIAEMEKGTQKCKHIVQNLLGFSRQSLPGQNQRIDLREVLNRSILITELRTRSLGIRVDLEWPPETPLWVLGNFNPLAQVFCSLLQNSYEAILQKRKQQEAYAGRILIRVKADKKDWSIDIIDDGVGLKSNSEDQIFDPLFTTKDPEKNPGLGLTLAKQILEDHKAQIFVSTHEHDTTCAHIRFPRFQED